MAHKYRDLHIPVDNIVQDWFWWYTMGEPVFDKARYPDPKGMVDDLHSNNFHLMISFWPYFRPGTKTYDDMEKQGFFIAKTKVGGFHPAGQALYDAFNPAARKYYWNLMDKALFKIGVDAWWLDTTEPETEGQETTILASNKTALGNGARFANMFPLMTTSAVYQGQREASHDKRVFILSRSAFAGAQRNATAVWSGDVNSDWVFLKKQIPAGLELLAFRLTVLDYGHRRIRLRQPRRSSLSRTVYSLVSVRYVQSNPPSSRDAQHRSERTLVLWSGCSKDSGYL